MVEIFVISVILSVIFSSRVLYNFGSDKYGESVGYGFVGIYIATIITLVGILVVK